MIEITNEAQFRESLKGMSVANQREVGASFVSALYRRYCFHFAHYQDFLPLTLRFRCPTGLYPRRRHSPSHNIRSWCETRSAFFSVLVFVPSRQ